VVDNLDQAVAKLPKNLTRGTTPQVSAGVGGPEGARPAEVRFLDPWGKQRRPFVSRFSRQRREETSRVRLLTVQVPDLAAACEF